MYFIDVPDGIQKIMKGYIHLGLWHRGHEATVKETAIKYFYSIYYTLWPIAVLAGGIASDTKNEAVFLVALSIILTVLLMRLLYIIWRQKDIYELIHRVGVCSINDEKDFTVTNKKLKNFMKLMTYFYYYVIFSGTCLSLVLPFIGSDKKLFINIGFPLDYKNNTISYWIVCFFAFTEVSIAVISVSFSIIIWYLLICSSLKYKVLGSELENMGIVKTSVCKRKISEVAKRNAFNRNLIAGINSHKDTEELIQQLESFILNLLSVQLATSALCICTSVYCLGMNYNNNIMELSIYFFLFVYNIFDIFMVMYFGNEIKLSSDGLSYCLFKSNWVEQSKSCRKTIIIFGERLKQAHQLLVLQIYPLTLETFTSILNAAYSLFNILKTST